MDNKELIDIAAQLRRLAEKLESLSANPEESECTSPEECPANSDPAISFALNDRYRFQRELFGGSAEAMNSAVSDIADLTSAQAVERYLVDNDYDMDSDVVKDFLQATTRRFDSKPRLLG